MTTARISSSRTTCRRRGVLLLVVLSMLTLFLLLGAAYLAAAGRAREVARAHARLTFGGDETRTPYARLLDAVALDVIRGGYTPTANGAPPGPAITFESLLADKYGSTTLTGTATGVAVAGPVVTAQLTLGSAVNPTALNGRVLTFVEPGRPATSHRIIRAQGGSTNAPTTTFTVALDMPIRSGPFTQPAAASRVIINDREFAGAPAMNPLTNPSNESWDAFDDHNAFLAQVAPGPTISTSTVSRLSYVGSPPAGFGPAWEYGTPDSVPEATDNDGDGVPDGIFLDFGLPDSIDASGNVTELRASVLVVDLDGRFNVNAHGSLAPMLYAMNPSGTHPGWTDNSTVVGIGSLASVPMGSGYGPAEITANLGQGNTASIPATTASGTQRIFDAVNLVTSGSENPKVNLVTGACKDPGNFPWMSGQRLPGTGSRFSSPTTDPNETPRLRYTEGKYGEQSPARWLSLTATLSDPSLPFARPGRPNVADAAGVTSVTRTAPGQPPTVNYGVPAMWWNATGTFDAGSAGAAYPLPRGIYNSPPDLHGRMKTLTLAAPAVGPTALSPQLVFVQPEWSANGNPMEIKDNPYELQLDTRAGFGGWLKDPSTRGNALGSLADNPFTPAELEPVLRPYDIDTNRCQPRLAALLGSAAEDSRLKITTDSWDTTAIVGGDPATGAAAQLTAWLQAETAGTLYGTDAVTGMIGGEVARGERFDLNRPLAAFETGGYSATDEYYVQRQAYFKDLYTLLVALEQGGNAAPTPARAAELAQWAANVVEFRDADSRVTPFEYDRDPRDGWSVDGNMTTADAGGQRAVVWGAERPEVLIRETLAWDGGSAAGGLVVSLYRPWNAVALSKTGTIAGEPCDYAFDTLCNKSNVSVITGTQGIPGNIVDLGKKAGPSVLVRGTNSDYNVTTAVTYPIWRLRLVAGSGTFYSRFDTSAANVGTVSTVTGTFAPATLATGNDRPKLPVDTTLTVYPGPLSGTATVQWTKVDGTTVTGSITISGSACQMAANFRVPTGQPLATVYLERLSDPSQVPTQAQWEADPLDNLDTTTDTLRYVVVDSGTITNTPTVSTATNPLNTVVSSQRRDSSKAEARFWKSAFVSGATISMASPSASLPSPIPAGESALVNWLPWLNRPFVSAAELFLVPQSASQAMLASYREFPQQLTAANISAVTIPLSASLTAGRLFDAMHVPTRFAGIHASGTVNTFNDTGISNVTTPVNQFSSFREPGRVNLNTVTGADVWNTVVGGPLPSVLMTMVSSAAGAATPTQYPYGTGSVRDLAGLLARGTTGELVVTDTNAPPFPPGWDRNPLHRFYTATRLANTVTPRSHVFGIWVTLRQMAPNDPDSVRYHRAFYVVDRSIPVGYESGRTYNVWDCVRVRRIIE